MPNRKAQSGQALALFAVALLLVSVMTFFTIGTGQRLQEKIKAQATADSAAYGLAVSQARAMNVMALSNRAVVGEYVSALSVAGHISWMNIYEWTFDMQAELWQKLKADNQALCGLYQYCHTSKGMADPYCKSPTVCCKSPTFSCCAGSCPLYGCYAAACSVPNSLFDTLSQDWFVNFGARSFKGIHSKWHEYPSPKIMSLGRYAAEYVHEAWRANDRGIAAFNDYYSLLENQHYTAGLAKTVDARMTQGRTAANHGTIADLQGAAENLEKAVQIFPHTAHAGHVADPDWDVFNEVLTGTRGGGHQNYDLNQMFWQPQHGAGPGYFDADAAAEPNICNKGTFHPSIWKTYSCSSDWDEGDEAPAHYLAPSDFALNDSRFKGGEMMLDHSPGDRNHIHEINTGNYHNYGSGDLGGRGALSAEDHAKTTANFAVNQCIAGYNYPPSGMTPNISMVCLSETGRRWANFAEVAHDDHLVCMKSHVQHPRGLGDDPNPAKGYNVDDDEFDRGKCNGDDTEVGFFRFDISKDPELNPLFDKGNKLAVSKDHFRPQPVVDLFNQPFTYASTELDVTHDENGNPLPWDFKFGKVGGSMLKLDQSKDEHGNTRDTRDTTSFAGNAEGMNTDSYRYVRGFASGLSYYHNPASWKEVPNLFNPYWRANLAVPGKNALKSLKSISKEDCEVGKEIGFLNGTGKTVSNDCN